MTAVAAQSLFEIAPGNFIGSTSPSAAVSVLMLQASSEGVKLSTVNSNANDGVAQIHTFAPGWSGLLILERTACNVVAGHGVACVAELAALAKLQAFLDAGRALVEGAAAGQSANRLINHGPQMITVTFREQLDGSDWHAIESWFMKRSVYAAASVDSDAEIDPDMQTDFDCFAEVLRSTEYYKLVQFLLSQPASMSMQELSAIYGLSYSHFRKLCREALGRGGKAEFQQWRNVRALLDMVDMGEQGGNLTDVALRQGFASSSHFSDAMKNQFGISPRYLMRALDTE
jgi:AraC-like DNA-binding protein